MLVSSFTDRDSATMPMPKLHAVFFDFDGVIASSTEVKVKAFADLFAHFGPEVQEAVVCYHLANGGMPRHQKLSHCWQAIARQACDAEQLQRLGDTFAALVFEAVVAASLIDGALETLQLLQAIGCPAFVVSGTPHEEMNRIVQAKALQKFFLEVHGSPRTKPAILTDILSRYPYQPELCLFIGDALADYRAAQVSGMPFLGIVPTGAQSPFAHGVPVSSRVSLAGR